MGLRPLYEILARDTGLVRNSGNAGLWYDKYCNTWPVSPDSQCPEDWTLTAGGEHDAVCPKLEWINSLIDRAVGDAKLLEEFCARQAELLAGFGQSPLFFKTDWRFVTGLGREHPLENGFAWHQVLGTPYLPGSSIKGMLRAYAEYWLEIGDDKEDLIKRVFGSPVGETEAKSAGSVIILDAIPLAPVKLEADVMTPHYGPYYQDGSGATPPGDWHSPVPLPFMVVSSDTSFQFGLAPKHSDAGSDLDVVRKWLADALDWIGAGAKTAVGYGRMSKDENACGRYEQKLAEERRREQEERERERRRQLTPNQRQCEELREQLKDPALLSLQDRKGRVKESAANLLKAAMKWPLADDRSNAAETLEGVYDTLGWGDQEKKEERRTAIMKLKNSE